MEYFNITRFQDCIEHLCYYDVCGVNWHDWPYPHFSGNFWWANSEYVAGLPPLSDLCRPEDCGPDSRHWCERGWAAVRACVLILFMSQESTIIWNRIPDRNTARFGK